jgi:predicted double-glycine peptidase
MTNLYIDELDFEDDENIKIIDFPITRQAYSYTCGCDIVERTMEFYGENFRESDLVEILKTNEEEGTLVKNIVKFFHYHDLKTELQQDMTIDDLIKYVDKNIPVIVLIQAWGTDFKFKRKYKETWGDGHFVAVIGYTDKLLLISDPSLFNVGYIPKSEFMNRWHDIDDGLETYQLGLAVFGRKAIFDKDKLERVR